ncbi:MAG: ABC transporter ATP-binding protein, partial [Clostridia bacterium]|nr:ABC transporter ATP-binding protein [Clostridia bacterium]
RGEIFGLLGPNGAGKSTTIDVLCTLLQYDTGEIIIDGYKVGADDGKIREIIGVVFQDSVLDKLLTVRENLATRAKFYGKGKDIASAVEYAAKAAGVTEFIDRPYGKLSGGQRRRADIARALVNTPKILFLDEPTTGLDPNTRKMVWDTIASLQSEVGMTVFLTTHYMEEAAAADYIIIIDKGEISAKGTTYELKEKYSTDMLKIKPTDKDKAIELINSLGVEYICNGELILVSLSDTKAAIPIIKRLEKFIDTFEVVLGTMDDVFINITGGAIHG